MYENIPNELKSCPNWICWQAVPQPRPDDPDHIGKIPINPHTGGNAQSNNPDTWSDFGTAVKASEQFTGIGFMFGNSPYFGVDIDKVEQEIREFLDGGGGIVTEFIHALQSYTELSPSYLSRLFKKELGIAVSDYIREKKIDKAQNLLKYSDFTLVEIANYLSFSSQSHFIQTFEKLVGMTPKKYRDRYYRTSW